VRYTAASFYIALIVVGIGNILRFRSINGMTGSLTGIYAFSILESIAVITWLIMVPYTSLSSYIPYAATIYLKLIVGLSFMHSILELRYAITHFFKKTPIEEYKRNLKMLFYLMFLLRLLMVIVFLIDIYLDYYIAYFRSPDNRTENINFLISTYWIMSSFYLLLSVSLIWQATFILYKVKKELGGNLRKEQKILSTITILFSIGYVLFGTYYIVQV
jgi:hypothetical protein